MPNILLIEDDRELSGLIGEYLTNNQFEVSVREDGVSGQASILEMQPDIVMLDLMLPGKDGISVCRDVRPHYTGPILMLTAKSETIDHILGLEIGADDYVCKPVEPRLLLSRIRALLRRAQPTGDMPNHLLQFDALIIDTRRRTVSLDEKPVALSTPEYDLLQLLATHSGKIFSRDDISRALRKANHDALDRSIDIHMVQLRAKLGDNAYEPRFLKTIRNRGYVFVG